MTFEELLNETEPALQRYVRFQIGNKQDAEDILQETRLAAFRSFSSLRDQRNFRAWVVGIARRKCADYYRLRKPELPLDELPEDALTQSLHGLVSPSPVRETLDDLSDRDKEILRLFYFEDLPQERMPICSVSLWARSKAACTPQNGILKTVIHIHRKEKKQCLQKCRKPYRSIPSRRRSSRPSP